MNLDQLITSLRDLDLSLREQSIKVVNVGLSARNWLVGTYLVEFAQNGEDRAEYGDSLIPEIAQKIAVNGLGARSLEACRLFYRAYPEIPQTLSAEFDKSLNIGAYEHSPGASGKIRQKPSVKSGRPDFALEIRKLLPLRRTPPRIQESPGFMTSDTSEKALDRHQPSWSAELRITFISWFR